MLRETLNLSQVAASAAFNLRERFGEDSWLKDFLAVGKAGSLLDLAGELEVNPGALRALYNRLGRLTRYQFLSEYTREDAATRIIEHLQRGKHVFWNSAATATTSPPTFWSATCSPGASTSDTWRPARRPGAAAAASLAVGDRHRRGPQVPESRRCFADHLRRDSEGAAEIQRHPDGDRPAPSGIEDEVMSQIGTRL